MVLLAYCVVRSLHGGVLQPRLLEPCVHYCHTTTAAAAATTTTTTTNNNNNNGDTKIGMADVCAGFGPCDRCERLASLGQRPVAAFRHPRRGKVPFRSGRLTNG